MRFPDIALSVPRVALPHDEVSLSTWSVIACDQHTSHRQYWEEVARRVGEAPSSLHLVLPEVFLHDPDRAKRIRCIRGRMRDYLERGVLVERQPGFVLVDRRTPRAGSRKGLMVALDLEAYSHEAGADTLIRTTEGTVLERLPPRVQVRRGAVLEVPHILVLIDDPQRTVIEPLCDLDLPVLYDTELMLGGGHVRGWLVAGDARIGQVTDALSRLATPAAMAERYGVEPSRPLLYAMGDGNHSFAAARQVWARIKDRDGGLAAVAGHPARHALVELVNLHDEGLRFEPIHRVLFGTDSHDLLGSMQAHFQRQGSQTRVEEFGDRESWERARRDHAACGDHHLPFVAGPTGGSTSVRRGVLTVHRPRHELEAVSLEEFVSGGPGARAGVRVDYIHGEAAVEELGAQPGNAGLFSRAIDKHVLFRTILREGPLPRKSFSLGEAGEKRYYLECRRIAP